MRLPKGRGIPLVALLAMLAFLGLGLSATGAAFSQGTSFGKVEHERPKTRQEWTALLRRNILRQVAVAQSTLQIARVSTRQRVIIRLVVNPDGAISDVQLEQPSKFPAVDRAVLRVVRNAQKQPPFTLDMPNRPLDFTLPVNIKP